VKNLQFAATRLKAVGIKLLIEAINTRDIPGFFLCNTQQAVDIIKAAGSDNLFVQYDIYHMQIMEGDLAPTIEKHPHRQARLRGLDRLRIQAGGQNGRRPRLDEALFRIRTRSWPQRTQRSQREEPNHREILHLSVSSVSSVPSVAKNFFDLTGAKLTWQTSDSSASASWASPWRPT
jgi:hypothetical protein